MMYDVIIVGAGPAGLTAAIYVLRAGKTALVLEEKAYGGQIINTPKIENYPGIREISGFSFATALYEQAKELGADIVFSRCVGIELYDDTREEDALEAAQIQEKEAEGKVIVLFRGEDMHEEKRDFKVNTEGGTYLCHSVILATGAKNRPLGLPGEEGWIGKGISYCATCDGAFFRDQDVAVVGGGNTALEDALFLSNYCRKVFLIHRRDSFRGEKHWEMALREKENVTFYLDSVVTAIQGEDRVSGVTVRNKNTGQEEMLSVAGVFVAIGQMPDNKRFSDMISLDSYGYILAGEDCVTSQRGIFAAGDCRVKNVRQLTTAAADGAVAGLAACSYC